MSSSKCFFVASIQVYKEAGKVILYPNLFKNFLYFIVIYTVKSFILVNEADVHVFLEFPCFFYDPEGISNLISGSFCLF